MRDFTGGYLQVLAAISVCAERLWRTLRAKRPGLLQWLLSFKTMLAQSPLSKPRPDSVSIHYGIH